MQSLLAKTRVLFEMQPFMAKSLSIIWISTTLT